jgi:hypothetical protein
VRGPVTRRKRNADGNPTEQSHDSPALDTRFHTAEIDDNDQTSNLIADSMYAQCDPDGNQHLLLADIVDHRGMDNATRFKDQTDERADAAHTLAFRMPDGSSVASGMTAQPPGLFGLCHCHQHDKCKCHLQDIARRYQMPIGYQKTNCPWYLMWKWKIFDEKQDLSPGTI